MSAVLWYLAGLVTGLLFIPALALIVGGFQKLLDWLWDDMGWKVQAKPGRNPEGISDYTLRRDIWFERQRGPVFTGHWCRDILSSGPDGEVVTTPTVTRWWGLGSADGRSVMLYHRRRL